MRNEARNSLLDLAVARILSLGRVTPANRAVLVAVSGIDASGKGYLTTRLAAQLGRRGLRIANINADGWLNLPRVRFSTCEPGRHFYEHGLRLTELVERLILPLRARRSLNLEIDYAEETATKYRRHRYEFRDVDIILLEGIFLLKREFRRYFDFTCWVDCSFSTAFERAVRRGQEGLLPDETIRAFNTIYFPAQRVHLEFDNPHGTADHVIENDPRLARSQPAIIKDRRLLEAPGCKFGFDPCPGQA